MSRRRDSQAQGCTCLILLAVLVVIAYTMMQASQRDQANREATAAPRPTTGVPRPAITEVSDTTAWLIAGVEAVDRVTYLMTGDVVDVSAEVRVAAGADREAVAQGLMQVAARSVGARMFFNIILYDDAGAEGWRFDTRADAWVVTALQQ